MPAPLSTPDAILKELAAGLAEFTPELRKAATFILENSNLVSVSSIRELAREAEVKPNTLVRLARAVGFPGYEDFRKPFREQVISGADNYPDRARWLQALSRGGKLGGLYRDMATAAMSNLENVFLGTSAKELKAAADDILAARTTYVLGVGVANAYARKFAYLLSMALDTVVSLPRDGLVPADGLVRAASGDVLLAMTFKPYRREVVEAVATAQRQGVTVIAVSDSPAAPVFAEARHAFLVPTDSPQFFTSTVALASFLETLIAFVIADAGPDIVSNIEAFHARRKELGIYWSDDERA